MKIVKTVYHPKTKKVNVDIVETNDGLFYYDIDGDWYNDEMGGYEECEKDAKDYLESIYNGSYFHETSMEASEKKYKGYF